MSDFVRLHSSVCDFSGSDSWVILSEIEQSIKNKIEAIGTPLKDWDIQINYGIKTGFNDAFIISTEKRDEILANCKTDEERQRTADLIRPILRGRDIKRYGYDWAGLWLINTHNGVKGKYPPIDIKDYPTVKKHLDSYWDKIEKRDDKGVTPYNLRNCAYMDDFFKPKIIFQEIVQESQFMIDNKMHFMCNDTCRIIVGKDIDFLLGIMNSKLFFYAIKTYYGGGGLGKHAVRMKHTFFQQFHCIKADPYIKKLVNSIVTTGSLTTENEINTQVYKLYNLTPEEIDYIENREP